jgi:hypothetical protein
MRSTPVRPQSLERIAALGSAISVQNRTMFQAQPFVDRYGHAAARTSPPIRAMLDTGLTAEAGSDAARAASYNPWLRSLSLPPACRQKTAAATATAARRISAMVRSVKPWIAGGTFAAGSTPHHHRTDATAVQRGSVTGPPIIGWLVSRTGSWQPAWWMSCAFAALDGRGSCSP